MNDDILTCIDRITDARFLAILNFQDAGFKASHNLIYFLSIFLEIVLKFMTYVKVKCE